MKVPTKILDVLSKDASLSATVNQAIEACSHIISDRPDFFPEYTDHGPAHNTDVLDTAIGLLTEDAVERLSSADHAVLTLSVLLHDCGMHLTPDTFAELISPANARATRLDEQSWKQLWEDYILEAKRFDGRQLVRIFGSSDPISDIPEDTFNYTSRHKLLIGEFLRRHHPRLAHEISIFGFPAIGGKRVEIIRNQLGDLAEISGLVARSHGLSLRGACDVFSKYFHEREYQGVHPPIIMAALRIADYLQIQPERAPKGALELRKLRSPFSASEWRVHQSIRNITPADRDPEAIFVDAQPENVESFLKFSKWAKDFQSELDLTWAALGEVYGRFSAQGFDKFQLRLRRIRTNIDDERAFSKGSAYLPAKICFEASSPDLLGLLIAPLYGNKPSIGLRELIQNSIDAVIERKHVEKIDLNEMLSGHDADVLVYPVVESGKIVSIIVEDRGIGMDADVIRNYFLRAGASFRSSSQWKKGFLSEDGHSVIARTGRFGVGALAGFLLGAVIKVETRRLGQDYGLEFLAELDNPFIEVRKCKKSIGTRITIVLSEKNREAVSRLFSIYPSVGSDWDWYCNESPSLLRLNRALDPISPTFIYRASVDWVSLSVTGYNGVLWNNSMKVGGKYGSNRRSLYSNGIYICSLPDSFGEGGIISSSRVSPDWLFKTPTILVTDNDGRLPVNLQRSGLSETDNELSGALRLSLAHDIVAQAIALAPEAEPFFEDGRKQLKLRLLNASCSPQERPYLRVSSPHWCWEDCGWRLVDPAISMRKPYILVLYNDMDLSFLESNRDLLNDVSIIWHGLSISPGNASELQSFIRMNLRSNFYYRATSTTSGFHLPFQTVCSIDVYNRLISGSLPIYMSKFLRSFSRKHGNHVVLSNGAVNHPLLSVVKDQACNGRPVPFSFTFASGTVSVEDNKDHILVSLWRELLGDSPIPVGFEERRRVFPEAFRRLGDRIDYYRKMLSGG